MAFRVSVIFANLDHYNAGMLSVEMAFHTLIHRHNIPAEVAYYRAGSANQFAGEKAIMPYRCGNVFENTESILSSDAIVFWGDFQHTAPLDAPNKWPYMHQGAKTREEGFDLYYRTNFLEGLPAEVRSRVIIFGESIATNVGTDYRNERYRRNLGALFKDARLAALRDIHSAISATHCAGDYARPSLGCDAALLLDDEMIGGLPKTIGRDYEPPDNPEKYAAVFLGRTRGIGEYRRAARFVRRYCRAAGKIPVWIPWLPRRNAYHEHVLYRPIGRRGWGNEVGDLLGCFRHFGLVITDTYHFSLNAWRSGTPAICIGRGAPGFVKEVDEKKKEIFYRMYDAGELYVFRENLRSRRRTGIVIERVRTALEEAEVGQLVLQNIRAHAAASETMVLDALRDLSTGRPPGEESSQPAPETRFAAKAE